MHERPAQASALAGWQRRSKYDSTNEVAWSLRVLVLLCVAAWHDPVARLSGFASVPVLPAIVAEPEKRTRSSADPLVLPVSTSGAEGRQGEDAVDRPGSNPGAALNFCLALFLSLNSGLAGRSTLIRRITLLSHCQYNPPCSNYKRFRRHDRSDLSILRRFSDGGGGGVPNGQMAKGKNGKMWEGGRRRVLVVLGFVQMAEWPMGWVFGSPWLRGMCSDFV